MYYYPIIHSFETHLSINNGNLSIDSGDDTSLIPVDDIGLAVCVTQGVTITSNVISQLANHEIPVIFTDQTYHPVSVTHPTHKTIDPDVVRIQRDLSQSFQNKLWQEIEQIKIDQQEQFLERMTNQSVDLPSGEAKAAREYWPVYFELMGKPDTSRHQGTQKGLNGALDFGYVVLSSMVHRFLVANGLIPALGIHHKVGRGKFPLVYDLVEPFRPLIDYTLFNYKQDGRSLDSPEWKQVVLDSLFDVFEMDGEQYEIRNLIGRFVSDIKRSIRDKQVQIQKFSYEE